MTTPRELYHRLWRTGFERGKFELKYATEAECVKMRLNLYRAVKPFRVDPHDSPEPGFTRILEKMEMAILPPSPNDPQWTLIIRNKELNPLLLEASKQLDDLASP